MVRGRVSADTGHVTSSLCDLRRWPSYVWGVWLATVLLVLSFLPPWAKGLLHTRGSLHYWAHLGIFVALAVLFTKGTASTRSRVFALAAVALLGCSIEGCEAGWCWPALEVQDVACDLLGVTVGWMLWGLRQAAASWGSVQKTGLAFLAEAVEG